MVWGYLQQFWGQITGLADYPVEFFQNIGNAVAGALGNFLDTLFHNFIDIFVFIGWFGESIKSIFLSLLAPVNYFFSVIRFFFTNAFGTPAPAQVSYTFSQDILDVFATIPHWAVISSILGAMIIFVIGLGAIKLLLKA